MFNVVLAHVDNFQAVYVIETKLDFVSFDDKNFKDDDNLLANVIQNSYAGQVQCLSQSRDQKS